MNYCLTSNQTATAETHKKHLHFTGVFKHGTNQQEGHASRRDIARVARRLLLCRQAFYSSGHSAGGHSTVVVTVQTDILQQLSQRKRTFYISCHSAGGHSTVAVTVHADILQ